MASPSDRGYIRVGRRFDSAKCDYPGLGLLSLHTTYPFLPFALLRLVNSATALHFAQSRDAMIRSSSISPALL